MGHVEQVNAPIAHAHDDQNQDQSASTRRRVFNGYFTFLEDCHGRKTTIAWRDR